VSVKQNAQLLVHLATFLQSSIKSLPLVGDGLTAGGAELIIARIDRYFVDRCSSDEALGLRLGRGETHPGDSLLFEKRDAALRLAVAMHGGGPTNENLKTVASKLERYHTSAWPRERFENSCPKHRRGRIEEYFWHALRARDRLIGWEQIRNIVAASAEGKSAFSFPGAATNPSGTVDSDPG